MPRRARNKKPRTTQGSAWARATKPKENSEKNPPADGRWYWRFEAQGSDGKIVKLGKAAWLTEVKAELELAERLKGQTGTEAADQKSSNATEGVENVAQLLKKWLEKKIKPAVERRATLEARRDANWSFDRVDEKAKKGKRKAGRTKLPGLSKNTGNTYSTAAARILRAAEWTPGDDRAALGTVKLDVLGRDSASLLDAYYNVRLTQQVRQQGGRLVWTMDEEGNRTPKLYAENPISQEMQVLKTAWLWGTGKRYCRGTLTLPEMGEADEATEQPHRMPTRAEVDVVLPLVQEGWRRDLAFVLGESGCRPEAMHRLHCHEVDTEGSRVRLKAKGFDRTVQVLPSVIAVLGRHLKKGKKGRLWPAAASYMKRDLPRAFAAAIKEHNANNPDDRIEPFGPYGLRSLVSREHILAGTPPHTYARLMGHSAKRALEDYAGVLRTDEAAANEGVAEYRRQQRLRAV